MTLVLASRSPQRRRILEQLGVAFRVEVPDVAEITEGPPTRIAEENARLKAGALPRPPDGAPVLGADTIVVLDGRVLGKPRDREEAERFLRALSGREHAVLSGICVREGGRSRSRVETASVRFRTLDPGLLGWYLETGEWRERAGAYAVQGRGAALVERIEGDFWCVVGLPVPGLLELLPDLLLARGRSVPGA